MNFKIPDRKKKIIKRIYKVALIFIGIIIIIFNDTFGRLEGFVEFIAFYFIIVLIFSMLIWVKDYILKDRYIWKPNNKFNLI